MKCALTRIKPASPLLGNVELCPPFVRERGTKRCKTEQLGQPGSQRLLALSCLWLSGLGGGIGLRTRRSGVRISQGAPFFSRGYQEIPNLSFGCNGCNWQFRCHCGHVETKASLLRCESAELNIFLHFRV